MHIQAIEVMTRRVAIANGMLVSFCNQPMAHYLAIPHESHAAMSLPSAVAGAAIWLRQESLRHIMASPGYAPGTVAVNFTWMKRGLNTCQSIAACTHLSSTVSQ